MENRSFEIGDLVECIEDNHNGNQQINKGDRFTIKSMTRLKCCFGTLLALEFEEIPTPTGNAETICAYCSKTLNNDPQVWHAAKYFKIILPPKEEKKEEIVPGFKVIQYSKIRELEHICVQ
jgi:hypothetical protein